MATGIVGATGFIGSYLCKRLDEPSLRIFTRNPAKTPRVPGAEIVHGDLLSNADCKRFLAGLKAIFYLAHTNTPINSDKDQPADATLNLTPLLTLLSAIRELGTKPHIVYFGSGGAVYVRNGERRPFREGDPCAPSTSYGVLKLAAEQYLRLAAERGELTATVLRIGNAYGALLPQHRTQGLIGVALSQILHGNPVRLFGSAGNVRDYVHLQDITAMVKKASTPRRPFDVVNVGSAQGHSVNDVLALIRDCHGSAFPIHLDERCAPWLTDWVVLDNSYARREFDWAPAIGLREGIADLLAASQEHVRAIAAIAQ